jgi:hypothetical protein
MTLARILGLEISNRGKLLGRVLSEAIPGGVIAQVCPEGHALAAVPHPSRPFQGGAAWARTLDISADE